MKSYRVAFLLAAGMSIAAVSPALAERDELTWNTIGGTASASQSAPKASAQKAARVATNDDDGSRPQRKSAPKSTAQRAPVTESSSGSLSGVASYYWQPQALASGGRFNPDALTAAHKTLPFGTRVRVTHAGNGRSVEVVINDRGPYIAGRIIDLSRRAAEVIGMTGQGIARVNVSILGK